MLAVVFFAALVYYGQLGEMGRANDLAQQALNKGIRDGLQSAKDTRAAFRISQAQLELSRKALDANERAWVLVQAQGFSLRPQPFEGNPQGDPLLNGVMVNVGKSPALKVVYVARVSFELARPNIPPEESSEWKEASGLDLAPRWQRWH